MIEGVVEGYADEYQRRYKILQDIEIEQNSLRHIVSYIHVFKTYEEALQCKEEYTYNTSVGLVAGNIVHILDKLRNPILDTRGNPCTYQVTAIYSETSKVGLVTSYGEYIGTYDRADLLYVDEGPIFKKEDYSVGNTVVWVEDESVYEGVIATLHSATAKIVDVKKLMPIDYSVRIPYWKIPEGRKSMKETSSIIHTVIGDDLD